MAEQQQKRAKHEATDAAVDQISDLPYPILHLILSLLPPIDVIRTSVLSKTFLSLFTSFPVVDLEFHEFARSSSSPLSPEKMTEFIDYVDFRFQRLKLDTDLQRFRLVADIVGRKEVQRIKKHINFAIKNRVQELGIDMVRPRYSLPRTLTSANSIVALNLAGLKLVNLTAMDLNSWWPMLKSLSISRCTGLKVFDVSSTRIRSISLESCVGLKNIKIKSSSLESFIYCGLSSKACEINISECKFIKVLSLGKASIGDNWVEDNIPKFPHLEDLKLIGLWSRSRNLKISSQKLKKLEVVKKLGRTEIQASNVDSLRYSGSGKDFVNIAPMPLKSLLWETRHIEESFLKQHISNISKRVGLTSLELKFDQSCRLQKFEINQHYSSKLLPPFDEMVPVKFLFRQIYLLESSLAVLPKALVSSEVPLHVTVSVNCLQEIDNQKFVILWNWIACVGHVKAFTLDCSSLQDLDSSEKVNGQLLTPMYNLKHLTVKLFSRRSISPETLNTFLWQSPNLETLHFVPPGGATRSIEFEYVSSLGNKDQQLCCRKLIIKC